MIKKILYIKAQGLGDMISGIPFLVEMKKQGNEVTQIFYDMNALMYLYDIRKLFSPSYRNDLSEYKKTPMSQGRRWVLDLFKEKGLIYEILDVPIGLRALLKAIIKYYRYFDEAVVVINTRPGRLIGKFFAKKSRIVFADTNDNSTYKTLSEGELEGKTVSKLFDYQDAIKRPLETYPLPSQYVSIFPSLLARSPSVEVWKDVIHFLKSNEIKVMIVGGVREQRFIDELQKYNLQNEVINTLGKTTFGQMYCIVKNSLCNIMCNGGVMRLSNLVNPHNINIHTVSAFLMEPPVDSKFSYTIRPYLYPKCKPCEGAASSTGRIPTCVFYDTQEEGACRNALISLEIIITLKKILHLSV